MKNFYKNHPFISIGLVTLAIITAALFITALSLKDTVEIEIKVAPISASIAIDGKNYQNGTFRIPSGAHTIKIEKEGFIGKEFSFDTNTTTKIYSYLVGPNNDYSWYLSHPEDALLLTSIGDYEAKLASTEFNAKYPISTILPIIYANYDKDYNYTEYRIDGGSFDACNSDFCIKITDTTGGNYDAALQKIRETGFNPEDYQILYEYTPIEAL